MSKCKPGAGSGARALKNSKLTIIDSTEKALDGKSMRYVYVRVPYEELRDNKEVIKLLQDIVVITSVEDEEPK